MDIVIFEKVPVIKFVLKRELSKYLLKTNLNFTDSIDDLKIQLEYDSNKILLMDFSDEIFNFLMDSEKLIHKNQIKIVFYNDNIKNLNNDNFYFIGKNADFINIIEKIEEIINF